MDTWENSPLLLSKQSNAELEMKPQHKPQECYGFVSQNVISWHHQECIVDAISLFFFFIVTVYIKTIPCEVHLPSVELVLWICSIIYITEFCVSLVWYHTCGIVLIYCSKISFILHSLFKVNEIKIQMT